MLGSCRCGCIRPLQWLQSPQRQAPARRTYAATTSHPPQGADLRDALLGRIFGYAAVVRSGRALPPALARSLAAGLVAAAAKKSFLREVSGARGVGGGRKGGDLCVWRQHERQHSMSE